MNFEIFETESKEVSLKKTGFLWFWDDFPKYCSIAWVICMAAAFFFTWTSRDAIFLWGTEHLVLFSFGMAALLILVAIGNLVPGIPNMPAPLVVGWACAAGLPAGWTTAFGLMVLIMATIGSMFGYGIGWSKAKSDSTLFEEFELEDSEQHGKAWRFYRTSSNPILWSRIGTNAALCGHVNLIAGAEQEEGTRFCIIAGFGHFLWTLLYLVIGFALGLLPEIRDFAIAHPLTFSVVVCMFVGALLLETYHRIRRR